MTHAKVVRLDADGLVDGETMEQHMAGVRAAFDAALARLPFVVIEEIESEPAEILNHDNLNDVWSPGVTE